ncbi:patched domain-containing protein 3 isoform X2 [Bradysia coprophila]|nr:patched domain-containing protein 3 isoform X2 [Bradysia coprophila]
MTCGISLVDKALNKSFGRLGVFIGHHPGYFVIIPILLTMFFVTGIQQLKYQMDPEYLFSPVNGEGKAERAIVESYFKTNYTHRFDASRITRPGRFGRVIITPHDGINNLIRPEIFKELRILDQLIQNTTVYHDGEEFKYADVCAKWQDECFNNDILGLDKIMDEIISKKTNLTFPFMINPVTWDLHLFPVFFGGTVVSADNTIISVPSLQLIYFVTADTPRQDARGSAWEEAFLATMAKAVDNGYFKHIFVARFASRTLDHELERNTRSVIPYFTSTFVLMAVFSVITCMMGDQVRSKPWLGLLGNLSAIMATCAAFGLAMYLGIEFIGINLAAPFLMISIGIDDTFVMLAAWRRTSMKLSVPERMGLMLSDAAVSITITSVTDMVSFWIGIFSPFQSVRIFCTYSGFAVCFIFVWHITFFAGCMALSGYCEEKNLHSIFGFKVQPMSVAVKEKRSWFYKKFVAGGIDRTSPDSNVDNKEHALMKFFRDSVAGAINKRWVKALIIITFGAYLAGAGYGLTQMKEGLERRKLSKDDSYSVKFFDLEDEYYREFPYRIQVILTGDMNYSDPNTQKEIEKVMTILESTSYVTSSMYTESWLRTFLDFIDRNHEFLNITINSEQDFIDAMRNNWLFPGLPYSLDVKFNKNGTRIEASRFLIQAVNITDTNHEKDMVRDLRQICRDSSLNITVFHPYFVFFDQFELVRPTSIQSMAIGAIIMMIISFIFIPNFLCSLWVALSILSIELGVAGYMSLWDVNLDSISMINLIMCIGFSVDFTAHICYSYMSSKSPRPDDKVREALYSLGMPIMQGAASTILGCIGLLLADSYIFLVFFKMIFLVIFFGAMHGLFLLPVLLSLFGPGSCTSHEEIEAEELKYEGKMVPMEKSFSHAYVIPHPQLALSGPFGSKSFLGAPYKGYGIDDKDQGIGTSGEDSSESSSSKSQRRQAIEDENTRRRYEEGWRRSSSHNLTGNGLAQFQPSIDLFGVETKRIWPVQSYNYDAAFLPAQRQSGFEMDRDLERRKADEISRNKRADDQRYFDEQDARYYPEENRRYSDDRKRRLSDERRPRKYSPPEGIYRPNPNRSSSQHNLYYPRQPQRSSSYHSIHQLKHTGDIRFP